MNRSRGVRHIQRIVASILFAGLAAVVAGPGAADDKGRGENRERIEPMGWLWGGALGVRREIYKDFDRRVIPLPIIGYRDEKLQVYGPFANYEFLNVGNWAISGLVSPRFSGFDESDSDVFAGMDDREFSMDAGLGIGYQVDNWKLELASLHDILNRSDGNEVTLEFGRVFRTGPLFIEPKIGLSYLDDNHVDYYYGVAGDEATAGRPAFEGEASLNTTLSVSFVTPIYFNGLTRIAIQNTWFDPNITDSPLTDSNAGVEYFIRFSRFF
jgi:outer membrane protein